MPTSGSEEDQVSPLCMPTIHITSNNAAGKAVVHSSITKPLESYFGWRTSHSLAYTTSGFPPGLNNDIDIKRHQKRADPAHKPINTNSSVCRIVDFAPNNKPMMHRTQSLDYGVVPEDHVIMELDGGSITSMTRGDVAIQRATMHAWKNGSDTEWARMLFVSQDCQPSTAGGARFKGDLGLGSSVFSKNGND